VKDTVGTNFVTYVTGFDSRKHTDWRRFEILLHRK